MLSYVINSPGCTAGDGRNPETALARGLSQTADTADMQAHEEGTPEAIATAHSAHLVAAKAQHERSVFEENPEHADEHASAADHHLMRAAALGRVMERGRHGMTSNYSANYNGSLTFNEGFADEIRGACGPYNGPVSIVANERRRQIVTMARNLGKRRGNTPFPDEEDAAAGLGPRGGASGTRPGGVGDRQAGAGGGSGAGGQRSGGHMVGMEGPFTYPSEKWDGDGHNDPRFGRDEGDTDSQDEANALQIRRQAASVNDIGWPSPDRPIYDTAEAERRNRVYFGGTQGLLSEEQRPGDGRSIWTDDSQGSAAYPDSGIDARGYDNGAGWPAARQPSIMQEVIESNASPRLLAALRNRRC